MTAARRTHRWQVAPIDERLAEDRKSGNLSRTWPTMAF
jgi:hypothetical protein